VLPTFDVPSWALRGLIVTLALGFDPNTASGYVALGIADTFRCEWLKADTAFRQALTLASSDAEAVNQYAQYLGTIGQNESCLDEIERAQQLDPLSPIISVIRAGTLMALRRDAAATEQIQRMLTAHPPLRPGAGARDVSLYRSRASSAGGGVFEITRRTQW
jgi:Tfp pilus assembly protein PilF